MKRRLAAVCCLALLATVLAIVPLAAPASAATPGPLATITAPGPTLLGESFELTVAFDNTATTATGFGPYLDVFLPVQGADGDPTAVPVESPDGVGYVGPVTYLGAPLTVTEVVLSCDGTDAHPYTGQPIDCASYTGLGVGDVLLVIELPFGSFTPTQPAAPVHIGLELSELADLDQTLPIYAAAGFRYGADPLDNPAVDPPIVQGTPTSSSVQPTLATLNKTYLGPEDETATGPNYPRTWLVELTVADGQVLDDLVLTDLLPDNVAFLGAGVTVGDGVITASPPVGAPQPAGVVEASFAPVTGTGGVSAAFTVDFFVPEMDADGDPVLDPQTGLAVISANEVSAVADWEPTDDRDPVTPLLIDEAGPEHILTDRSLAIQKSVEVVDDVGAPGPSPGDTLEWILEIQVSDFFTFEGLEIADVLSDGQSLHPDFVPTLSVSDPTGSATNVDLSDHLTVDVDGPLPACDSNGEITWDLDLSGALLDAVPASDGRLTGGLVDDPSNGATTATVVLRTVIDDSFRCDGDAIDSLDSLANTVRVSGEVVSDGTPTGNRVSDDSSASVVVQGKSLDKSVYARNGDTGDLGPQFAAGDTITYRLTADLPLTNHERLSLTDFLPLPTLEAAGLTFDATYPPPPAVPAAGMIQYGPAETRAGIPDAQPPTLVVDTVGNSFTLSYPDIQDQPGTATATIDVLFTVTLTSAPFADALFLTNQARLTFGDSFVTDDSSDEIVQFTLTNPQPAIHKGVVATDGIGTLAPPATGSGAPWAIDATPRFSPSVTSDGLASQPIGSNLDGAWAGDRVAYAVVVENTGSGLNGAFDVTVNDVVPDGMVIPAGGVDLQVTDGAGAPLDFSGDLFGGGLVLDNGWAGEGTGGLAPFDAGSGQNLAVITYVLEVSDGASMTQVATNTATVTNFAAAAGANSYPEVTSQASVTVAPPALAKTLTSTSQPVAPLRDATIGATATYQVVVSVPPSTTDDVVLRDTLDAGLAFVSFDSLTATPGITSDQGDLADILAGLGSDDVSMDGRRIDIVLGQLTNDTDQIQTLTFTSTVAVLNVAANQDTTGTEVRRNLAELRDAEGRLGSEARADSLIIVEPALTVGKVVAPGSADAGDTVTFTITVAHPGGERRSDAFDVELEDVVPAGLTYVADSFVWTAGLEPDVLDDSGPLTAGWNTFSPSQTATLQFQATVDPDAVATEGSSITNTVDLVWTSLPGETTSTSPYTDADVERTGAGGVNDYATDSSATLDIIPAEVDKALVGSSAAHTDGTELTIGEVATFRVEIVLPEGDLGVVVVTDAVPAGMAYVGGSVAVDESGFEGVLGSPGVEPLAGGGDGEALVVTFDGDDGDGSGPGVSTDPTPGTSDTTVVITYDVVVLDVAGNQSGGVRTNAAAVTIGGTTSEPGDATISVVAPSVGIAKAFTPTSAAANDPVTITLTVTNSGTSDAFDLEVTDLIDGEIFTDVVIESTPPGWTGAVTPVAGDASVAFSSVGPLTVGASVEFEISATLVDDLHENVTVPGTHSNTAEVTAHSLSEADDIEGERRSSTDGGSADLELVVPDLRTTKSSATTAASPGETYTYTIRIDNDGGRDASGVTLVDSLPDSTLLTFDSASDGGLYDPDAGDHGTVTWSVPTIPAGGFVERTVTVTLVDPVPAESNLTALVNSADAQHDGSNGPDPTPENNDDTWSVTLESTVDVAVSKDADVAQVSTEGEITYTVTVSNVGNEDVVDITVTDLLPGHVSVVSVSGGGTHDPDAGDNGTVSWTVPALPAGGGPASSVSFTIVVEVDPTVPAGVDDLTNGVSVSTPGDDNPDNDSDTAVVTLDAEPVLTITKTDDTDGALVAPGDPVVYTIVVSNVGDQGATGVTVVDTLPDGLTFLAASADGTHDAGVVTWNLPGELAAGADVTLVLEVLVDADVPDGARELTNVVVATDDGQNSDEPTSATDDDTIRVNVTTIDKSLTGSSAVHTDGAELVVGEVATYELVVTLPEGDDIGAVTVIDQIPAGMAYVGGTLTVDMAGFQGELGAPAVGLDPDGGSSGQPLTVSFSGVEVDASGDPATAAFRLTYDAVVLDVAANVSGTTLANQASTTVAGVTSTTDPVDVTVVEPAVDITKAFGFPDAVAGDAPGSAAAGDTVSITLTVTNTSGIDAFDLVVTDPLDGSIFASAAPGVAPTGWSVETAEVDDDIVITFTGGELGAGDSVDLTLTAVLAADVPVPGSHVNTTSVGWQSLPGDDDNERTYGPVIGQDIVEFAVPDLRVVKVVDGPTEVEPGDQVSYEITVHNDGGRQAVGITLVDELPGDTSFVSASDDGTEEEGIVTWPVFSLAAGGERTYVLTVQIDDPVSAGANVLTNRASATDDGSRGPDPTPDNNSDTAIVALDAFVDLAVTKEAGQTAVGTEGLITYTLTVTSEGNEGAQGIELTDTLPDHVAFVEASGGGTEAGGVVSWPPFDLDGDAGAVTTAEFTLTVRVAPTVPAGLESLVNAAAVAHPDDVNDANDDDSATVVLDATPDLAISKSDGQDTAVTGSTLVYEIVVSNVGDQGATGVTVVDALPDGLTFVAASGGGVHDGGVVTWNLPGELGAGDSVTLTLEVTVDDPLPVGTTSLTNTVTVADDGNNGQDPNPDNNSDTDVNTTGADLSVVKEADTAIVPGAPATYRVVVSNAGPETVGELSLVDTLPPGLTDPVFAVSAGSYDPDTGIWDGVSLASGSSLTMTITVAVGLDVSGEVANAVSVQPLDHADPDGSNNSAETIDPVEPQVDLVLAKTLVEHTGPGGTALYELTVRNDGPSLATGVVVVDDLPDGLTADAADAPGWTCDLGPGPVTCAFGSSLAPGESASVRLSASIADDLAGDVVNRASVSSDQSEVEIANNVDSAVLELPPPTDSSGRPGSGPLPSTGGEALRLAALGLVLMLLGMIAVVTIRGRRRLQT